MRRRVLRAAVLGLLLCGLAGASGCGYSLAGRGVFLPEYIRVINVPEFSNATAIFDADRVITAKVRSELIGRGRYKVTPERTGGDALLTGAISSIALSPVAFNEQQQASRYVLVLSASIEFTDVKTGKVLWANPAMQFREEFEPTTGAAIADAADFFGQDANALDRIATEFARSTVSALLEAF